MLYAYALVQLQPSCAVSKFHPVQVFLADCASGYITAAAGGGVKPAQGLAPQMYRLPPPQAHAGSGA